MEKMEGGGRWKSRWKEEQMVGGAGGGGLHPSRCWSALQVYRAAGRHSCVLGEFGFIVYRERHPGCEQRHSCD
jgi:hypothetical protein